MNIADLIAKIGSDNKADNRSSDKQYALAYVRVSTEFQEDKGLSLPAQRSAIERYAEKEGIEILEFYREARSGFSDDTKRTEFNRMLERANSDSRVNMIIVHDYSRFSRDGLQARLLIRNLEKVGVEVISLNDPKIDRKTSGGVYAEAFQFAKNEVYIMDLAMHTRKGMRENTNHRDPDTGYCFKNGGQPLFGYKARRIQIGVARNGEPLKKTIWVLNDEIVNGRPVYEWARAVLNMAQQGDSLDAMTAFLNDNGVPAPRVAYWGPTTVHSLLELNCLMQYAGYATWNVRGKDRRRNPVEEWDIVENGQPAIISLEQAAKIYELRKRFAGMGVSEKNSAVRSEDSEYILSGGLFKCARCGSNMVGHKDMNGKHRRAKYYVCNASLYRKGLGCGSAVYIDKDWVEQAVIDEIRRRLRAWLDTASYAEEIEARYKETAGSRVDERTAVEKQLAMVEKKIANIYKAIEDGLENVGWANDQLRKYSAEKAELLKKLDEIGETAVPTVNAAMIANVIEDFDFAMIGISNAQKRRMIRRFVTQIRIEPESKRVHVRLNGIPADFTEPKGAENKLIPNYLPS